MTHELLLLRQYCHCAITTIILVAMRRHVFHSIPYGGIELVVFDWKICKNNNSAMSKRKRSIGDERRVFNPKWELEYFMIDTDSQGMLCLICNQVIKTVTVKATMQNNIIADITNIIMQN